MQSNLLFQYARSGLCFKASQDTFIKVKAQCREEAGGNERQKDAGTHLASVVVVHNHSQDKSRHCPVFSLKTIYN